MKMGIDSCSLINLYIQPFVIKILYYYYKMMNQTEWKHTIFTHLSELLLKLHQLLKKYNS